jgi:hypothetical protein
MAPGVSGFAVAGLLAIRLRHRPVVAAAVLCMVAFAVCGVLLPRNLAIHSG